MVYSDAAIIAFMDLRPINSGHLLVVPRAHAARLADLDERLGAAMFAIGGELADRSGASRRSMHKGRMQPGTRSSRPAMPGSW